jgi:hypothetical protein
MIREDKLDTIRRLAHTMKKIGDQIDEAENYLKTLKEEYNKISAVELPEQMAEVDLQRFVLQDGTRFTVKPVVSIKPIDMDAADEWLSENGHSGMVKLQIEVPRGTDPEIMNKILTYIKNQGVQPEYKKAIHPQTLARWCREMDTEGLVIPDELFAIFRTNKTVID